MRSFAFRRPPGRAVVLLPPDSERRLSEWDLVRISRTVFPPPTSMDTSGKKKKELPSTTEETGGNRFQGSEPRPDTVVPRGRRVGVDLVPGISRGGSFIAALSRGAYKDASNQWRYTRYFGLDDLGKVISLCEAGE